MGTSWADAGRLFGVGAVRAVLLAALPGWLLACGPVEAPDEPAPPARQSQALSSTNGLSLNGLSLNGLSLNGLSLNGLSLNGLAAPEFAAWFNKDPAASAQVMTYVVRCAVPAGQTRSYTNTQTGVTYTWQGALGLAPDWSCGKPATVTEQQVITACLGAHANKYGVHLPISVLARTGKGQVNFTSAELSEFSHREACFFGNLFNGEGIFVGNDRGSLNERQSTPRGCGLVSNALDARDECPPFVRTANCQNFCTLDSTKTYYVSCNYNGKKYQPVTTRLREQDVYLCGDGTCQFTESCGNSLQYYDCGLDCGACPAP